jgi:hypothetical protein
MRVGLAGFRPCIRFHSSCATSATAYAVSAFSFVFIRFFYIAVTLLLLLIFTVHNDGGDSSDVLCLGLAIQLMYLVLLERGTSRSAASSIISSSNGMGTSWVLIYLMLSVACSNRWWITFNGNVLGTKLPHTLSILITRWKMRHPTHGIGGLRTWEHYKSNQKTTPSSRNDEMK